MQSWSRGKSASIMNPTLLITTLLSITNVGAQFYSDYGEPGGGISSLGGLGGLGGAGLQQLNPFDIPVIYKERTFPAAYPVAPTIYQVALMQPIEPMPGKKTVPLYMIPEDSLHVNPSNNVLHRSKRSIDPHGQRLNIKYPEFFGLTDGYHIPAVEIPLHKPMIVRQIEVNVLAPEGFMVPFYSEDRHWPYPMTTGCLVAAIPRNTYVSDDHPITIRRLFAVPSLPEYPTYRAAFPNGNQLGYPVPVAPQSHSHGHSHSHAPHGIGLGDGVTLNFYPNGQPAPQQSHHQRPALPAVYTHPTPVQPKGPVFELVPVTPKSSRRSSKRRNGKKRDESDEDDKDKGSEEDDDENDSRSKNSGEENSEEDDRKDRRCRNGSRSERRSCRRRDRTSTTRRTTTTGSTTTTRTTTTPTTTTPTTTTPPTTTPSASSIQDIIAAFSSYRDRERERDDRRNRISASFYEDEERERSRSSPDRSARDRSRDRDRGEGLRTGDSTNSRERDRDNEPPSSRQQPGPAPPSSSLSRNPAENTRERDRERERESRTSSSSIKESSSESRNIQELREQALQKQINQLQRLLTSLNLTQDGNGGGGTTPSNGTRISP